MIYTFLTWLIANLMHPLIMIAYFGIGGGGILSEGLFQTYTLLLMCSLLFSLPSFFISCLLIHAIKVLPLASFQKYITWIFIAISIPFINLVILEHLDNDFFREFDAKEVLPASIAVLIAVLIRYRQFMKFLSGKEYDDYENSQTQNQPTDIN
jgi:hypothetical protein